MTPYATPKVAFVPVFILLLVIVIPLLVLFIRLCIRKPKVAAIIALVPLVFIASIVLLRNLRSHQVVLPVREITNYSDNSGRVEQTIRYPNSSSQSVIINNSSANQSPIWSEGIEDQFEADVYPSKISAIRSIAIKMKKQLRNIMSDSEIPETIVLCKNSLELYLVEQLRDAITKLYPEIKCRIVGSDSTSTPKEVVINFYSVKNHTTRVSQGFRDALQSGTLQATISNQNRSTIISVNYVDQPWVEDFSSFANSQPDKHYIVAKSTETCLSPEEAGQQAMNDACSQVGKALLSVQKPNKIDYQKILKSGVVVDKFLQSLDGSAGKIWRQAILLDVSNQKLNHLADILSGAARVKSMDWARMVFSIIGLFVLITIVYIFLNAATRGYYSWSLRIVGVILAAVFLIIILKIT